MEKITFQKREKTERSWRKGSLFASFLSRTNVFTRLLNLSYYLSLSILKKVYNVLVICMHTHFPRKNIYLIVSRTSLFWLKQSCPFIFFLRAFHWKTNTTTDYYCRKPDNAQGCSCGHHSLKKRESFEAFFFFWWYRFLLVCVYSYYILLQRE